MSRWEFMRQLEELLFDISPSEREEALQYYNDYFNDAGRENEQEVIAALGSPEQVAKIVRDGLSESAGMGEFTENGFSNSFVENKNAIVKRPQNAQGDGTAQSIEGMQTNTGSGHQGNTHANVGNTQKAVYKEAETGTEKKKEKEKMPTWAIVLIIIGCVLFSPAIISLAASALAAIASVIVAVFAFVLGIGAATLALYVVAIALVIAGFSTLMASPVIAAGLIGAGLICAAIGILFMMLTVFLAGTCLPGICKGIAYIFQKLFGKKEVA